MLTKLEAFEDLLTALGVEGLHLERREALPRQADGWTLTQHRGYEARACTVANCPEVFIVARGYPETNCGSWKHARSRA